MAPVIDEDATVLCRGVCSASDFEEAFRRYGVSDQFITKENWPEQFQNADEFTLYYSTGVLTLAYLFSKPPRKYTIDSPALAVAIQEASSNIDFSEAEQAINNAQARYEQRMEQSQANQDSWADLMELVVINDHSGSRFLSNSVEESSSRTSRSFDSDPVLDLATRALIPCDGFSPLALILGLDEAF